MIPLRRMVHFSLEVCLIDVKIIREHNNMSLVIHPTTKFILPLLALDQTNNPVSTTVKMLKSSNTRLLPNQDPQPLQQGCSELTYNIYSNDTQEQVVLHPDGPCRESGLAGLIVHLTLLACPNGSGDHCVCEERLQEYANCFIDDSLHSKKAKREILDGCRV